MNQSKMRDPKYIQALIDQKVASPDVPVLFGVSESGQVCQHVVSQFYMVISTGHLCMYRLCRAVERKDGTGTDFHLSCANS